MTRPLSFFKRDSKARGDAGETYALRYLEQQGLTLVCRNYRCKMGEVDLILKQEKTWVFVEVRMRKSSQYGSAVETVTAAKQRKIRNTAQYFMLDKGLSANTPLRFDVVGIDGTAIQWIVAAF